MRRTVGCLAIALGVAGSPAVAQSPGQSEHRTVDTQLVSKYRDASAVLVKARSSFEKRDFAATKKHAEESLRLVPNLPEGHLLLAKVAYLEKDYPKALSEVEAAKTGFESTAALRERMEGDRVNDLRKRIVEKGESISQYRGQMASAPAASQQQMQIRLSNLEAEKAELEKLAAVPVRSSEVPAEYDFLHGNVYLRTKMYDQAVVQYASALRKRSDYADAANNLASIHFSAGQYAKAQEVVTRAEAAGAVLNPELKKAVAEGLAKTK